MATNDRTRLDRTDERDHVCTFCGETFDVDERTTCPACEAEVILRGER